MGILAGLLGCLFGILGILTIGFIFVPLAAVCTVVGLLRGIAGRNMAGVGTSLTAGVLTVIGFAVSPSLWLLAGGLLVASQANKPTASAITAEQPETPPVASASLSDNASPAGPQLSASQAPNAKIASQPPTGDTSIALDEETNSPAPGSVAGTTSAQRTASTEGVTSSAQPTTAAVPADSEVSTQPSFDCAKASTTIERTICADRELSQWDGRMGAAFKRNYAQIRGDQRRSLLKTQRQWIVLRKSQCDVPDQFTSEQCILRLTEARVAALEASAAPPPAVPASMVALDVAPTAVPELLPGMIDNVMVSNSDNACPSWNDPTQAEEIIVYLTGAIESDTDSIKDIRTNAAQGINDPADDPAAPGVNQLINEDQTHLSAMTLCRDAIAKELGLTEGTVRQLYDYNTLTKDESQMFSDLESENKEGSPNFSKLVAMTDQHKALHIIDLEIREIDYSLNQFRAMVDRDVDNQIEETDRQILANETDFRGKLVSLRASIASNLNAGLAP